MRRAGAGAGRAVADGRARRDRARWRAAPTAARPRGARRPRRPHPAPRTFIVVPILAGRRTCT